MSGVFFLARRHAWHHRGRSAVLIACLTLTCSLPLGMEVFSRHVETRLTSRAAATPLIIGAAGSRFDLALHVLYFRGQPPRESTMGEARRISESGFAEAVPLLARFTAQGFPIVGTTKRYLSFRGARVETGSKWERYGDCLLGGDVARKLGLGPGDSVTSEPENVFDLDGSFPLRMRVTGVLSKLNSPDDNAIFVDLHTAWIIAGIGHGHAPTAPSVTEARSSNESTAENQTSPAHDSSLIEYTRIDETNVASFHFHGERDQFPVSAIIAIPHDEESETLLMGRYLAEDDPSQVLQPLDVVDELLGFVLRIREVLLVAFAAMLAVTIALFTLLIVLTVKIREREFQTMFRLGASRFLMLKLVAAELLILLMLSGLCTLAVMAGLISVLPHLSFAG